jgi:hypothetical protein
MTSELRALVELGASGEVLDVTVRPRSRPAECFAQLVKKDTFSKPPADRFKLPVVVGFTQR